MYYSKTTKTYSEPVFKAVISSAQDVITTSSAIEEPTNNNVITPGLYDTPIIKL